MEHIDVLDQAKDFVNVVREVPATLYDDVVDRLAGMNDIAFGSVEYQSLKSAMDDIRAI